MGWSGFPLDVRGPLGLLGAGLLAGSAALIAAGIASSAGKRAAPAMTGQASSFQEAGMPADADLWEGRLPGPSGVYPVDEARPAEERPVIDPEPAPLTQDAPRRAQPLLASPQQLGAGPASLPARAGMAEVVYIVRLRGAPEADSITRNYRRDPPAAYAAWADLIARVPALAEFELAGATYSGELRLLYRMQSATPAAVRAVQVRLLAIDGVAYADPDFVAHPGEEDTP